MSLAREKESFRSFPFKNTISNQSNLNLLNFNEQSLHLSCEVDMIQEMSNHYIHNASTYFSYFTKGSEKIPKNYIFFDVSTP